MIEKIDSLAHKLTDNWIKQKRFGWRAVKAVRSRICDAYDRWLDG